MWDANVDETIDLKSLTTEIVAAMVGHNHVPAGELPALIASVHAALSTLGQAPQDDDAAPVEKPTKRQISNSIKPDHLVSFLDGKPYKMLRRHLTTFGHTPESYREKFGLPRDYPMVSSTYSEARRGLAKAIGLGRNPGDKVTREVAKAVEAVAPKAKRGRKPKTIGDAIEAAAQEQEG